MSARMLLAKAAKDALASGLRYCSKERLAVVNLLDGSSVTLA